MSSQNKNEIIKFRVESDLAVLLDLAALAFAKSRSHIMRYALIKFLHENLPNIEKELKDKIELLKSFEKSQPSQAKVASLISYGIPQAVAKAFAQADDFTNRLNIKSEDYSVKEDWWMIAARYYQGEKEPVEKLEKILREKYKKDTTDLGYALFHSKRSVGLIPKNMEWENDLVERD